MAEHVTTLAFPDDDSPPDPFTTPVGEQVRETTAAEMVGPVYEAEIVEEAVEQQPAGSALQVRRASAATVRVIATTRTVLTHPHTKRTSKLVGRHLWFPVAGTGVVLKRWRDAHGANRYERMMRQAELAGDREMLQEWETRDVAEKQRRHDRVMDWVRSPLELGKAVLIGVVAFTGLLLGLGILLAVGRSDATLVLAPILGVIDAICFASWFLTVYGATLLLGASVGVVAYLWHTGRTRTEAPAWMAPAAAQAGGRDVVPDEGAVLNALRNLNLPAMNKKFKEGWQPRWIQPATYDGQGWRTQLLLPEGVTVENIVDRKPVLAHNLLRLPVEVWPTEPRDNPGVLDLWVADQGSLSKPVAPWPLLAEGATDYFKGVPVGVNPQGKPVIGRLFQANWGAAGMMGSGKSTLIITMLLGAMLDPLVEIDVYCMAINADYDPLKPRLRTLFKSDEPDDIPKVLEALKQLMSELSERGRLLSAAGEPKLTRELAEADPRMRPRVVVIDECQELFVSECGEEAEELVSKIVAKARKYGVTLVFATPVPSADSLPRKVAKVLSNKACFAIGDHQGNDAILGTGKHKAGITATTLRPMTQDADGTVELGDLGTAMTVGFMPTDGLMRCYYVRRGSGVDEVTPVVQRALTQQDDHGITTTQPVPDTDVEQRDLLGDVAEALRGCDRLKATDVTARLREIAPSHGEYQAMTGEELAARLELEGVPVRRLKGVLTVRAENVHAALADRAEQDTDDTDDTGGKTG